MHWKVIVLAIAAAMTLQGCATMGKDECLTVDWRQIGYEDGAQGYPSERIGNHRKACAKHGVTPDLGSYQAGRDQGLREFCKPEKGFQVGSRGGSYAGVCPIELEESFMIAYRSGRELHRLESGVRSATSQISSKQNRLRKIDEELAENAGQLISSSSTVEQRVQILAETKNLAEEQGRLEAEVRELIAEKALREQELADYRQSMVRYY